MTLVVRQYRQTVDLGRSGDRYVFEPWPMRPCPIKDGPGGMCGAQIEGKNPLSIKVLDRLPPVA